MSMVCLTLSVRLSVRLYICDHAIKGDFNIDLLKYETHKKTNDFIDDMISHNFIPLITKPTRVTTHSATIIDHIYTNNLNIKYKSGILLSDLADHFGIFTILEDKKKNVQKLNLDHSRIQT
jgi:hypothetical protein